MNLDDRAISIADRIADGSAIDWTMADSDGTDPGERGVFEQLKVIAALAALHRAPATGLARASGAEAMRWGPLTITSKIGEGRFGQVHLAWDARLQRRVALKLLLASPSAAASSPEHSIEEARLLAKIRHPNVLAVHGAECVDGQVGIWTEFIEGRTLEAWLVEHGPMPANEVVAIGVDLCRALGAVHDAGLLHRDVKAQNVMREIGGRIVLMDFGTGHDLGAKPARPGDLSGTPLYLAPEILAGREATIASDLYALAVLLFRLLTGEYPVPGRTLDDVRKGHRDGVGVRLGTARQDLPAPLTHAIDRGLEPDPARRFASAGGFENALAGGHPRRRSRWRLAVAAAILIGLSSFASWQLMPDHSRPTLTMEERPWVLVADFENGTGDALFDGIAHYAFERELSNSTSVRVIPRQRIDGVLRLMKQPVDSPLTPARATEIAVRDGEVRLVITGRIDRLANGFTLTANLVAPQTGEMQGSVSEAAPARADVAAAVRRLANELRQRAGETRSTISQSERRPEQVTTVSLQALKTYTKAYDLGGTSRNGWDASLQLARQAVHEDPAFALAWIWLAWALENTDHEADALDAARRAVALSNGSAPWEQYWIRGSAFYLEQKDGEAIAEYQALLELVPHMWAARNLTTLTGDSRYFERVARDLPNDWEVQSSAARQLYTFGARAIDVNYFWTRGSSMDPERVPKWPFIPALLNLEAGDLEAASGEITRATDRWARSKTTNRPSAEGFATDVVLLRLGIGQVEAARQFVRSQRLQEPTRAAVVALLDFYSGRAAEARAVLARLAVDTPVPRSALIGVLTDLGLPSVVQANLPRYGDKDARAWIQGEIASGRGETDRALGLLEPALEPLAATRRLSLNASAVEQFYRASLTTANAWVIKGSTSKAIDTLGTALDRRLRPFAGSELARLNVLSRLAVLERRLGRTQEADALDATLKHALQLADPAFVNQLARLAAR